MAEAERWFRSAIDARPRTAGLPYAPYGFEARWQLAWIKCVDGDWDEVLRLTDVSQRAGRRRSRRALLESVAAAGRERPRRAGRRAGPGAAPVLGARGRGGRSTRSSPSWPTPRGATTRARSLAVYRRRRRRARPDLARVVQRPDPAGRGHRRRDRRRAAAAQRRRAARRTPSEVERLHADGHTVLDKYTDPSGHWGPEGRAWVKRLDAETLRARWLAGVDAPPQDALVEAWREAEQLFADFGHVHELADGPRRRWPASCAPPATPPAPASSATRPARPRTGSAPSRCSTGSGAQGSAPTPRPTAGVRHADRARGRDPRAGRRGPLQRRDRQAAVHQRQDRLGARLQHPRQARRRRPHRGRRDRAAAGPARLTGRPPGVTAWA